MCFLRSGLGEHCGDPLGCSENGFQKDSETTLFPKLDRAFVRDSLGIRPAPPEPLGLPRVTEPPGQTLYLKVSAVFSSVIQFARLSDFVQELAVSRRRHLAPIMA